MTVAPRFAHASEVELARILDYYQVRWEYEPRCFPLRWNLDGDVVESFAPDFYLPDFHLYVELTTLRQSLTRKKNRKLRRVHELYPMIRVKLLYAKDFRQLLLKYGRIEIAASLIGPEGQRQADPAEPAALVIDRDATHLNPAPEPEPTLPRAVPLAGRRATRSARRPARPTPVD